MKKVILFAVASVISLTGMSQVANHALQFESKGNVVCGPIQQLNGAASFTIQAWVNPNTWDKGATLLSRGAGFAMKLGDAQTIDFTVGSKIFSVASSSLKAGKWSQITLVVDEGNATALVDGVKAAEGVVGQVPDDDAQLVLGGGYAGRLDEVRIWDIALPDAYDRFWNTTLNEWVPNVENLLVYYKMDYADVKNLVEYTATWNPELSAYNNHGIISDGVSRVKVDDNAGLPYLINGAYTANERFWDRAIPRNQYLVANDLIILGIKSFSDGHLEYVSPNSHGTVTNGEYVASFEGRESVLHLKGQGANMVSPKTAFQATYEGMNNWAYQSWAYIEQWNEGAYFIRQESADGASGFSVRLGDADKKEVIVRVNGVDFSYQNRVPVGEWFNIAVCPNNGTSYAAMCITFYVNGKNFSVSAAPAAYSNAPTGADSEPVYFGENFKGYFDDINTWSRVSSKDEVNRYMKELPMPGIGVQQTADVLFRACTYYQFDLPEDLGYNSYSQDQWLRIMRSAYDGYTGYVVRISVKSHSGWQNTISSEARRKIFAADLARLVEPYDGCELDLEWSESQQQINNLGLLAQEIRAALPEGKSFFISCHSYAPTYQFPKDKMQYVDGFTFQNYGPQNNWFYYSRYNQLINTFVGWGFPKDKIVMSYAATTSQGYDPNGNRVTPIKGVRDGFLDGDYVPQVEVDKGVHGGCTYYFTGPLQTYNRAKACVTNNLGGIFYWDMGNDVPFEHKYNLAKHSAYALSANVDRIVTEVTPNHESGVQAILAPASKGDALAVSNNGMNIAAHFTSGERVVSAKVYSMSGSLVKSARSSLVAIDNLSDGVYTLMVEGDNGTVKAAKFIKK